MSKSKPQSNNKKRKREKGTRSSSSSEDHQLVDRENRNESESVEIFREEIEVDEKPINRKKKKKKRNSKTTKKTPPDCEGRQTCRKVDNIRETNAIEPSATLTSAGQKEQSIDDSIIGRKKMKKKKARRDKSPSVRSLDHPNSYDVNSGSKIDFDNGKIADDDDEDDLVLEGSMVSGILVLINRKTGKVYSATAGRLEKGERQQVGRVNGIGKVVLFRNTEEKENGTN